MIAARTWELIAMSGNEMHSVNQYAGVLIAIATPKASPTQNKTTQDTDKIYLVSNLIHT